MKKKLLILGAGIYQVPLIETAKRMGLETIVASIPGNYPGFAAGRTKWSMRTRWTRKPCWRWPRQSRWLGSACAAPMFACAQGYVCDQLGRKAQRGGGGTCPGQGADEGGL